MLGTFDPPAKQQPTNLLEYFDPAGLLVDSLASGSLLNHLNLLEDKLQGCTPRLAICLSKTIVSQLGVEEEEVKAHKSLNISTENKFLSTFMQWKEISLKGKK